LDSDHPACGYPPDSSFVPGLFPAALGYQYAFRNGYRFVAGGGIGFFVVETVRMGGYQQYATALWAVVVVIIIVDYISEKWREGILKDQPQRDKQEHRVSHALKIAFLRDPGIPGLRLLLEPERDQPARSLQPGSNFGRLIKDFVTIDLSSNVLAPVIQQMIVTIFQAFLATTLGALIALPLASWPPKT